MRIVSLLPSATEIVCALGAREALVGVSHECDFPGGVERLPHCSGVKRPLGTRAGEIDRNVKALLAETLSVYRVDTALLYALEADLIVTQAQCEVCAVSENELAQALAAWTGRKPQLLSLAPLRLADVWDDIGRVGRALEREEAASNLVHSLKTRVEAIERISKFTQRRRVALIDWLDPLIMGAEWMPELVTLAGGGPLLATAGNHATQISWEALRAADPEVIVIAPCGMGMDEAALDLPGFQALPGYDRLTAVRKGEVYLADGKHYFNRPGPRLVESLEILAEILHPRLFGFGHEGKAWRRLDRAREGELRVESGRRRRQERARPQG